MPPKRKATTVASADVDSPPLKRRLRSHNAGPSQELATNDHSQTRRRRVAATKTTAVVDEDSDSPAVVAPVTRTTRRRVGAAQTNSNIQLESIVTNNESESEEAAPAPKRRGRRVVSQPNVPTTEPDTTDTGHETHDDVLPKNVPKRRGRPPVSKQVNAPDEGDPDHETEEPSHPAPKRRGRPPALKQVNASATSNLVDSKDHVNQGGKTSKTILKRRGRPPASRQVDVSITEVHSTDEVPVEKIQKRRGRPVAKSKASTSTTEAGSTDNGTRTRRARSTREIHVEETVVESTEGNPAEVPHPSTDASPIAEDEVETDSIPVRPVSPIPAPSTPPRQTAPHSTTPRYILHSVHIETPRRLRNPFQSREVSPSRAQGSATGQVHTETRDALTRIVPSTPSHRSTAKKVMTASRALSAEETDTTEFEDFPTRIPFTNSQINTPVPSPTKSIRTAPNSPSKRGATSLPDHLHPHFHAQKTAILKRIRILTPPHSDDETVNSIAFSQLNDLMQGSVMRGEGNSCLLIGPRGSGKSKLVEEVISSLPTKPIVVRLSGHAQTNDRLAMREIAFQLMQQTGMSFMNPEEEAAAAEEADNPFIEHPSAQVTALPPPAHLLALISMIPTLGRPTVIVLDAFELFAEHARQSLLYCLFDTVQHSKVSSGSKGMAVIGVTARVDAINLLEKRVKSRFSGRMFRTACPQDMEDWMQTIRSALVIAPGMEEDEWTSTWEEEVDIFLQDEKVVTAISETYALTRDMRTLSRILTSFILNLSPSLPIFPPGQFVASVESQRAPSRSHYLNVLPYPSLCLLIASVHTQTAGHADFTFEMLCEAFYEQLKTSASAPVNIEGGGLGMVRCNRDQLLGAMERLVSFRAFKPATSIATGTTKEFVRYRCTIDRKSIKDAVDRSGQLHLRRWLGKPAN